MKSRPLAVQQKQIAVTCNYEARKRGLHKLQLIKDVKRVCPDVVIVSGEDLTRFRDVSKALYSFLKNYVWSGKVERLGFDEVSSDNRSIIYIYAQRYGKRGEKEDTEKILPAQAERSWKGRKKKKR